MISHDLLSAQLCPEYHAVLKVHTYRSSWLLQPYQILPSAYERELNGCTQTPGLGQAHECPDTGSDYGSDQNSPFLSLMEADGFAKIDLSSNLSDFGRLGLLKLVRQVAFAVIQ